MWPDRRLLERLNIVHPIIQAPMAGATTPELVAAVSNAGALGWLGGAMMSPEALRNAIHEVRRLTRRPFGVNLFTYTVPAAEPPAEANVIVGNVQSIQVPGRGRVYSDVGQTTIHIVFDENGQGTVEVLSSARQHDDDQASVLCELLAG